ncbi:MAG: helix-turn-helix transcriptional regulator [Chloroflexaceae bacterium]|jgi:DNA-binding HxlR family transcriptional regulator|nr:helix-turn-helix transcriptional regulator [Chloroflexaceae bacterium]
MKQKTYTCTIEASLDLIGGKWKIIILWYLQDQAQRYGALRRLIPTITEKMLIQQLRELEKDGLVIRHVLSEMPQHVEYELTDFGQTVKPMLQFLYTWGQELQQRGKLVVQSNVDVYSATHQNCSSAPEVG